MNLTTHDGLVPVPIKMKWIRDGMLLIGFHDEMQLFSPWIPPKKSVRTDSRYSRHPGVRDSKRSFKREVFSAVSHADISSVISLWMETREANPDIEQYHPRLLSELMICGQRDWVKQILQYLLKYLITIYGLEKVPESRLHRTLSIDDKFEYEHLIVDQSKIESNIEIESIPTLPLSRLIFKFMNSELSSNQRRRHELLSDTEEVKNVMELFDEEDLHRLIELLRFIKLPGLTIENQCELANIIKAVALHESNKMIEETIDENGKRFLFLLRLHDHSETQFDLLPFQAIAWALQSDTETQLISAIPALNEGNLSWSQLSKYRVGLWVRSDENLKQLVEKTAKAAFQRTKDPLDSASFYIMVGKRSLLSGFYRAKGDLKMSEFFKNDFTHNAKADNTARKNAYYLMRNHRYMEAIALFLLVQDMEEVVEVCCSQLGDPHLAYVITRLCCQGERNSRLMLNIFENWLSALNEHPKIVSEDELAYMKFVFNFLQERRKIAMEMLPPICQLRLYLTNNYESSTSSIGMVLRLAYENLRQRGMPLLTLHALLQSRNVQYCSTIKRYVANLNYISCLKRQFALALFQAKKVTPKRVIHQYSRIYDISFDFLENILCRELRTLSVAGELEEQPICLRNYFQKWLQDTSKILTEICGYDESNDQMLYRVLLAFCSVHSGQANADNSIESVKSMLLRFSSLADSGDSVFPSLVSVPLSQPSVIWPLTRFRSLSGAIHELRARSESILNTIASSNHGLPTLFGHSAICQRLINLRNEAFALSDCIYQCLHDHDPINISTNNELEGFRCQIPKCIMPTF
ncbi:hypothetical protein ACOME3_009107 [Neoechinorhynchus agilis]